MHHLNIKCQSKSRIVLYYDYMLYKTFLHTLVFKDASSPLFLTYCRIDIFCFSDNLSAENSNLSAESGIQRIQLLECMLPFSADQLPSSYLDYLSPSSAYFVFVTFYDSNRYMCSLIGWKKASLSWHFRRKWCLFIDWITDICKPIKVISAEISLTYRLPEVKGSFLNTKRAPMDGS